MTTEAAAFHAPSAQTQRGLDWLNFFLADVQTGVGPFLAIYLAGFKWDQQQIGTVLTVGGIAGILSQAPAGALVDRLHFKRALIAVGAGCLAVGAMIIALFPHYWPVLVAQALIGGTSSVFIPTIAAISLGVVGRQMFDRRQGRNQTFNAAGNVVAAVSMGLIGYFISNQAIFFFVVALTGPTLLALWFIRPQEIDHDLARGAKGDGDGGKASQLKELIKDRRLLIFLLCAVMFHFANAAMLPLLGEMLAKGQGRSSMMFMSACVITTQLVVVLLATWVGRTAGTWGRKPLLLIAFGVMPIRGVLYTLTHNSTALVAIQILDGIGAAVFGIVSVLVIADLTQGTGRFNVIQGAIGAAVGTGASLSQVAAGSIAHHFGNNAGFLFLAAIALLAFAVLFFFMPETLQQQSTRKPSPKSPLSCSPTS